MLFLALASSVSAQSYTPPVNAPGKWTWIAGPNSKNQGFSFGTQGVPSATTTPGAISGMGTATDAQGRTYLYGGGGNYNGNNSTFGILWRFDPATGQWTRLNGSTAANAAPVYGTMGVSSAANTPGGRSGISLVMDNSGNLLLFGGISLANNSVQFFNDLWKYNTTTGEWTWLSGNNTPDNTGVYGTKGVAASTNMPGGRFDGAFTAGANGTFWLFGGEGLDAIISSQGVLNDLWKYDAASNQWTWMAGSDVVEQSGTYGTLGVASAANTPGARSQTSMSRDANGNMYLFGGFGNDNGYFYGGLNDLWKFNVATSQWAWVAGSNTAFQLGNYGSKGVSAPTNVPGFRSGQSMVTDNLGRIWMYGGTEHVGGYQNMSDMWRYNPASGMWTWMAGSNQYNYFGTYGTKGVATLGTNPPGRSGCGMSIDNTNQNIWVLGGLTRDYPGFGVFQQYSDVWRYDIGANTAAAPTSPATNLSASSVHNNDAVLNWTKGANGFKTVIVVSTSPITSANNPIDGELYVADPDYSSMASNRIGGARVVYSAANTSIFINGLATGTTYYAAAYSYNRNANDTRYITTSPATTMFVTGGIPPVVPAGEPTTASSNLTSLSTGRNTMKLSWTSGNGGYRMLLRSTNPMFTTSDLPVDGQAYATGATIGNSTVVYRGTGSLAAFNGLTPNTQYFFALVEANGFGASTNYLLAPYATLNASTLARLEDGTSTLPLLAYPNPFVGELSVVPASTGTITLLDLTGRTLQTVTAVQGQAVQIGQSIAPGIYLVRNGNDVIRVVKGE